MGGSRHGGARSALVSAGPLGRHPGGDRNCWPDERGHAAPRRSGTRLPPGVGLPAPHAMRSNPPTALLERATSEGLGTALLLAAVVGSGIMGERLADGNVAIALLANAIATGAALVALILAFGSLSGAHFNPAVTLADAAVGGLRWREVPVYVVAQVLGAFLGVAAAHAMFDCPLFTPSTHARAGTPQLLSEFVATFGLLSVIWGCARSRPSAVPFAVGAYITAAYWFTASTSFANPAVTLARAATDTFAGIRPADAPGFIVAQLLGAAAATATFRWLVPSLPVVADRVVDFPVQKNE